MLCGLCEREELLRNWPLSITLAFLVAAGFCIMFSYYLSIHQSRYFGFEDKNV